MDESARRAAARRHRHAAPPSGCASRASSPACCTGTARPAVAHRRRARTRCATRSPPSAGTHAVLDVVFEGQKRGHTAIVKEHASSTRSRHSSPTSTCRRSASTRPSRPRWPSSSRATPNGVKMGGMLDDRRRTRSRSKGLPTAIPEHLSARHRASSTSATSRTVKDIVVPEGIKILDDPEEVICPCCRRARSWSKRPRRPRPRRPPSPRSSARPRSEEAEE